MSLHTEELGTLTGINRVNAIAREVRSLPYDQRHDAIQIYQEGLPEWEIARLTYDWSLHARDSQLPPDGDWDTWLIPRRTRLR